jgi:hypothetical protein
MTARIGPPVSFIGEVAGERTPGDLLPEDPDAVREGMGLGVRAAADSPRTV